MSCLTSTFADISLVDAREGWLRVSRILGVLHLFCGTGGGALGVKSAEAEWNGTQDTSRP